MKILYISDRRDGGIKRHVQCLRSCLPPEVEHYTIGEDEPFAGKSGHDWRELVQICRAVRRFRPSVVHFHTPNFFMALGARLMGCKRVCSWHTPTNRKMGLGVRVFFWLLGKGCYFLPVSSATWDGLKKWLPYAQGEVFYNPLKVNKIQGDMIMEDLASVSSADSPTKRILGGLVKVIGMVGRSDPEKGWQAYAEVAGAIKEVEVWGIGVNEDEAFEKFGSAAGAVDWKGMQPNGREWIRKMDIFVLTSKHEEMPTVVLECFAEGTPICGFIPEGGMSEILSFSNGALREVFIEERSCEKLSEIVKRLLADEKLRKRVVEDGWQILVNHFDAEKNCREQLMDIYRRIAK